MACEDLDLTQDINTGCENVKMDMEAIAYHIPWNKVTAKTLNTATGVCSAITIATGGANKVTARGQQPYTGTTTTGELRPYGSVFTQNFQIVVYGNTPTSAKIVNSLSYGKHVFLVEQQGHPWQSKYVLYGIESGMVANAPALEPYGDQGGWVVPMQAVNNQSAAMFLVGANGSATEALANAIKSQA